MRAVQAGCLDRFANLVGRYQSGLFRFAQSKLRSRTLAEDAVQDAFLAAFRSRASFDASRNFRGWLWTILVNVCHRIEATRVRRKETALAGHDVTAVGQDAAARLERIEQQRLLTTLLDRLPDQQADAVRMRFFGELNYGEIGEVMLCSPATAKSRVRYGLEKMARSLGAKEGSPRSQGLRGEAASTNGTFEEDSR